MNSLIVGGTSGLGLELARQMYTAGEHPIVTGRHDPLVDYAEYYNFELTGGNLPYRIGQLVSRLPEIDTLVYAAGFYQEGHIDDLSSCQIDDMVDVGGRGLVFFAQKILESQDRLDELVTITSTSQWVPREFEPVYNFVKAGAAHFSHGLSLDPRVGRTLVVGTSGMATDFWRHDGRDTSQMLPPEWVAERIMELRQTDDQSYTFAKILGATAILPRRIEVVQS